MTTLEEIKKMNLKELENHIGLLEEIIEKLFEQLDERDFHIRGLVGMMVGGRRK